MDINELEILRTLLQEARQELDHRRKREFQIFGWSSAISIGFIGILISGSSVEHGLVQTQELPFKLLASIILIGLSAFSTSWQFNQRCRADVAVEVITRILDKLEAFNSHGDVALFPDDWKWLDGARPRIATQLKRPSKMLATILLGVVGILVVWL